MKVQSRKKMQGMSAMPLLPDQPEGRLFIAVPLPGRMALTLTKACRQLERTLPGRYVPIENYHVTLAFIGNAPLSLAQELRPLFASAAARTAPVTTQFSDFGFFGPRRSAILWAGLTAGSALLPLAETVRKGLQEQHISFDAKPVRPHITVARKVNVENAAFPVLPDVQGVMDSLVLYHSTRQNGSLVYLPLLTVSFGGTAV